MWFYAPSYKNFSKFILLGTLVTSGLLLVLGWITLEYKTFFNPRLQDIQQSIIDKYTEILYQGNDTLDMHEVLQTLDDDIYKALAPREGDYSSKPLHTFNLLLGIGPNLHVKKTIYTSIYIFLGYLSTSLLFLCLSFALIHLTEWIFETSTTKNNKKSKQKDVVLEYKKMMENNKNGEEQRLQILSRNPKMAAIVPFLRQELIKPAPSAAPTLLPLFIYLTLTMIMSALLAWQRNVGFYEAFTEISEYNNSIDASFYNGGWTDWIITGLTMVTTTFYYTSIWTISHCVIRLLKWLLGIEMTPESWTIF